jgi:hypothetical protein
MLDRHINYCDSFFICAGQTKVFLIKQRTNCFFFLRERTKNKMLYIDSIISGDKNIEAFSLFFLKGFSKIIRITFFFV